ncbi:methyltransferase-like protein 25 isoform X1 [Sitophilus oryzae]|uniref:Methyltransferase-like protein 25 isoform X1 n=1 Tax=Sitophilus oryzae TaxID=7048 RepID=A0A6J2YNB7_SITOR|nr:methyltransferase-like protein 25 isoform X1 [Sitophilus oryzae]
MSLLTQQIVAKQIEHTLQHLEKFLSLANVHMVDYFTKDVYCNFISEDIRCEAEIYGLKQAVEAIYSQQTECLPTLNRYIKKCQELTINNTNICMSLEEFQNELQKFECKNIPKLKLEMFMKPKKSHEVEILSWVVSAIKHISNTSHIIDIGDGKGYLSSLLALHYKIPVLGIDASPVNTNGAINRAKKLSKVWNGVVTHIKTTDTSINLYKQITKFVDEKIKFDKLIADVFLEYPDSIGLTGLHTCGNLASSCLKIFNENSSIKTICNIGCCYHLLTDEFEPQTEKNIYNRSQTGFPMSQFLKNKNYAIGRGARMLASQSVERILNKNEHSSIIGMFYRALFEIVIENTSNYKSSMERHVGRFRKKPVSFLDYVLKAAERINMPVLMSESEIENLFKNYEQRIDEMNFFYLVRCMLAPVIESLILLDRLLYLLENEYTNTFMVQFFKPVISPRCYGIVSIK